MHDVLDHPLRVVELSANLSGVEPFGEQLQDLDLAIGQDSEAEAARIEHLPLKPPNLIKKTAEQVGGQCTFASGSCPYGFHEVFGCRLVAPENAAGTGFERTEQTRVIDAGDDQDDSLDPLTLERSDALRRLLVHLVSDDEGNDVIVEVALVNHVDAMVRAQLACDARSGNRVGR
jgi:hypothetical protein